MSNTTFKVRVIDNSYQVPKFEIGQIIEVSDDWNEYWYRIVGISERYNFVIRKNQVERVESQPEEPKGEFRPMGIGNPVEPNSTIELIAKIRPHLDPNSWNNQIKAIHKICADYLMYHPEEPKEADGFKLGIEDLKAAYNVRDQEFIELQDEYSKLSEENKSLKSQIATLKTAETFSRGDMVNAFSVYYMVPFPHQLKFTDWLNDYIKQKQ